MNANTSSQTTGTLSLEDIYGVGTIDTLGSGYDNIDQVETQAKTNPSDSNVTGVVAKEKSSIFNIKGNLFGQPIIMWFGMLILLVVVKLLTEGRK